MRKPINRRTFGKGALALGAASAFPMPALARPKTIKIGFVTPQTGPLAAFAEPDGYTLARMGKLVENGWNINGTNHQIEFIVRDSQSNANRAATVAQELLLDEEVDIITATSTPDTTNPVADQAELNGTPCVTNDTPWQPHFFGRGGDPKTGFEWTYHFFWGLEDIISTYVNMWDQATSTGKVAKVIGALWPNDPDGNAWGDPELGFPPVLKERGYELVDPGRYQVLTDDFSAQISAFKAAGVEITTGVVPPPDFTTFWLQAHQQGLAPKVATFAKATEFPQVVGSLGKQGDGLSVEVWWSPDHPYVSGLTGENCRHLAEDYEKSTGNVWTMPLGFKYSLFEVVLDALARTEDPTDPASIRDAIAATDYMSVVGPINFRKGPVPNIAKTPLVGGQWLVEGARPDLRIVENADHPEIPRTGDFRLIGG